MKLVIQIVKSAELYVAKRKISSISKGMCIYLGVEKDDLEGSAIKLAKKVSLLRVFDDERNKMNYSLKDIGAEILLIPQFTLLGSCEKGNRPDFTNAEKPERAKELYLWFGKLLEEEGLMVRYGVFGADMQILQENDGPVTIILEYKHNA